MGKISRRDYMRELVRRLGPDEARVVRAYATAEECGEVERRRNSNGIAAEQYARALWSDAIKKGWINGI